MEYVAHQRENALLRVENAPGSWRLAAGNPILPGVPLPAPTKFLDLCINLYNPGQPLLFAFAIATSQSSQSCSDRIAC